MQWGETMNHVFGRTLNPYNLAFTPGGSSGGEGALVAMKGSCLGVGTDIGGFVIFFSSKQSYDDLTSEDLCAFQVPFVASTRYGLPTDDSRIMVP
jgi:hypothetical protein